MVLRKLIILWLLEVAAAVLTAVAEVVLADFVPVQT